MNQGQYEYLLPSYQATSSINFSLNGLNEETTINWWMDKEDALYIYTKEYSSAIRKGWNLGTCNNMDGPRGYYAKWSKSDRERQYSMISLTCGI